MEKRLFRDKKGDLITPEVVFIIMNLIFFMAFLAFVHEFSRGASTYEQAYAKQIAFAIDSAKPYTQISIDFERGLELSEGKSQDIVRFNNNEVIVDLGGKGGYGFNYFSDYQVEHFFAGKELVIVLKEKNGV